MTGKALAHLSLSFLLVSTAYWMFEMWYTNKLNREACLHNIQNAQSVVRSYQGVNSLSLGDAYDVEAMLKEFYSDPFMQQVHPPKCPRGGTYTWSETIPAVGLPALRCSYPGHAHKDTKDW